MELNKLQQNGLELDVDESPDDVEIPIKDNQANSSIPEQFFSVDGYKEYAELITTNFEMKLGTNSLRVDQLANILLNCFATIKKDIIKSVAKDYIG